MKVKDIYEFEHNRNDGSDKYTLRLFREGMWWRAYEWSAYLAHNFPNGIEENKKLLVTKKHYKELNKDLVVVGLQLKSFEKYFPNIKADDDSFSLENGYIDIDVKDFYHGDIEKMNDYKATFESWKNSFKLLDGKNEKSTNVNESNNSFAQNDVYRILHEISNYQISNKTLIESITFLNDIQTRVKKILN